MGHIFSLARSSQLHGYSAAAIILCKESAVGKHPKIHFITVHAQKKGLGNKFRYEFNVNTIPDIAKMCCKQFQSMYEARFSVLYDYISSSWSAVGARIKHIQDPD